MMTKRIVVGLGVVVALAFGLAVWKGAIPPKKGMEGTIGAANRYHTEQIAAGDVSLTDPDIQDLLQSDMFHELVTDPNFRKVYERQSEAFRVTLAKQEFRNVVGEQGLAQVMNSEVFQRALDQNKYELLANANAADFGRVRNTANKAETLEKTTALNNAAVDASRTLVAKATEQLANAEKDYDRSVKAFAKVSDAAQSQALLTKVENERVKLAKANVAAAKAQAEYQQQVDVVSKGNLWNEPPDQRKPAFSKVEETRVQLIETRKAVELNRIAYDRAAQEVAKAIEATKSNGDIAAKVETARTKNVNARVALTDAQRHYDQKLASVIAPIAEKNQSMSPEAQAMAQQLARSEDFKMLFADANFQTLARTDEFARLANLRQFKVVASMAAFQRVAGDQRTWSQVSKVDNLDRSADVK